MRLPALALLLGTACAPIPRTHAAPEPSSLAITRISVVDVESGRVLREQTVLITGNRIQTVGPSRRVRVPAGARVVEGRGKFLIPGLIDTHVHLLPSGDTGDSLPALRGFVASGVTTVRDAGTRGRERQNVQLRAAAERGDLLSPRLYVSGGVNRTNVERYGASSAGALAREMIALGVDGLKIRHGLTQEDIRAVVEEARTAGLPVYGHVFNQRVSGHRYEYTREAILAGVGGVMHVEGFEPDNARGLPLEPAEPLSGDNWQAWWLRNTGRWAHADSTVLEERIRLMVERNVWLEPTLITVDLPAHRERYRSHPANRFLPMPYDRWWQGSMDFRGDDLALFRTSFDRMQDFVRRFHQAGGVVIAGTDNYPVPGFGLHHELRLLVEAGLSPLAALQAATINAARALRWQDRLGTIERGKLADLVLLDASPLADIRNTQKIAAVLLNGRYLDRRLLDELLNAAQRAAVPSAK